MGLELLFGLKALLVFILIIVFVTYISASICSNAFKFLGWKSVLKGYLLVLFLILIENFVFAKKLDVNYNSNASLIEIYLSFSWIAFFAFPLLLLVAKNNQIQVGKSTLLNIIFFLIIFAIFLINNLNYNEGIFYQNLISKVIFLGRIILHVFIFYVVVNKNKINHMNY